MIEMMVSDSDIQIWQNAVKGINETGKTDLIGEEWSALAAMNSSLSNGNFQSDESRRSYKTLKDNLNRHADNPALQKHLYDFIALCYKYATAQPITVASATTVTPSTSSENKQSVTVKSILFGPKGSLSKNLKFAIIYLLTAAVLAGGIYALNVYTKTPGYVIALVVGALAGIMLLRNNQNRKIREKLAFLGAAAAGIYMYSRHGEQISGGFAFVWIFLGVGLALAFEVRVDAHKGERFVDLLKYAKKEHK